MGAVVLAGFDRELTDGIQARLKVSNSFQSVRTEEDLYDLTLPPTVLVDPRGVQGPETILGDSGKICDELFTIDSAVKERFGGHSGLVILSTALPKGFEDKFIDRIEVDGVPIFSMGCNYTAIVAELTTCNNIRRAFFSYLKHETAKALQMYESICHLARLHFERGDLGTCQSELSGLPEMFRDAREQLENLRVAVRTSNFIKILSLHGDFVVAENVAGGAKAHDEVFSGRFIDRQVGAEMAINTSLTTLGEIEDTYHLHVQHASESNMAIGLQTLQDSVNKACESVKQLSRAWRI